MQRMSVDLLQQLFHRRAIRRIHAAVREKNTAVPVEQEISAALVDVFVAVVGASSAFASQLEIKFQRSQGKYSEPGQAFECECLISVSLRIGEYWKRPAMPLLVADQFFRLGEGNHGDGNAAPLELALRCAHLAEVFLAGKSSKMTQKDQQQALAKMRGKIDPIVRQIEQRQLGKINFCHGTSNVKRSSRQKKGAPRPSAPSTLSSSMNGNYQRFRPPPPPPPPPPPRRSPPRSPKPPDRLSCGRASLTVRLRPSRSVPFSA